MEGGPPCSWPFPNLDPTQCNERLDGSAGVKPNMYTGNLPPRGNPNCCRQDYVLTGVAQPANILDRPESSIRAGNVDPAGATQ